MAPREVRRALPRGTKGGEEGERTPQRCDNRVGESDLQPGNLHICREAEEGFGDWQSQLHLLLRLLTELLTDAIRPPARDGEWLHGVAKVR